MVSLTAEYLQTNTFMIFRVNILFGNLVNGKRYNGLIL